MAERLKNKVAIVVGAGCTPGETIGNGRATAILFAREGAAVLLVDRDRDSAAATKRAIDAEGGEASVLEADVTHADACQRVAEVCLGPLRPDRHPSQQRRHRRRRRRRRAR